VNFVHVLLKGTRGNRGEVALGTLDLTKELHDIVVRDAQTFKVVSPCTTKRRSKLIEKKNLNKPG
jgi:hypothetical protein